MANFVTSIEPVSTPAYHKLGLFFQAKLFKDGERYAMRYVPSVKDGEAYLAERIDAYHRNAAPFCVGCGCGVTPDDQRICPGCAEDAYQDHLDSQDDYISEVQMIASYCRGRSY